MMLVSCLGRPKYLVGFAPLALVGCGSSASQEPINANSEGVSYTIENTSEALADVAELARQHCASFDLVPTLQESDEVDGDERLIKFDCVVGGTATKTEQEAE